MSEPDEAMVEAVASAVDLCVDGWNGEPWSMAQEVARAVLSVPVVRDALARDAQVREIAPKLIYLLTAMTDEGWRAVRVDPSTEVVDVYRTLAVLYPSPGDDSDIMPGSEFDGPVVL